MKVLPAAIRWIWRTTAFIIVPAIAFTWVFLVQPPKVHAQSGVVFISLDQAMAQGENNHPDVLAAEEALFDAELGLERHVRSQRPNFTLHSRHLRMRQHETDGFVMDDPGVELRMGSWRLGAGFDMDGALIADSGDGDSLRARLTLRRALMGPGTIDQQSRVLKERSRELERAKAALARARQRAQIEVWHALYDLESAMVRAQLAAEEVEQAQAAFRRAVENVQSGVAGEEEKIWAEVDLLRAERLQVVAERDRLKARNHLIDMLGLDQKTDYRFEQVSFYRGMPDPGSVDAAVARAGRFSFELSDRHIEVEEAKRAIDDLSLSNLPEINFSTTYSHQFREDDTPIGISLQVQVSYPLYDGGVRGVDRESANTRLERALEALERAEENLQDQVKSHFDHLHDLLLDVELAQFERQLAWLNYEAAKRQATVGTITDEDLEAVEREVRKAQVAVDDAIKAYQREWLELQLLQGHIDWSSLMEGSSDSAG